MDINANTQIYDKTLDRAAMIRLFERRVNGKVGLVLNGHVVRVDKMMKDMDVTDKKFKDAADLEIRATYREALNTTKKELIDFVADQISYTYQNIENVIGDIWVTKRPPIIPEKLVLERPLYSDKTLAAGWSGVGLDERKRLEQVIRKGVAEGKTNNQIALDIRKGNVFNISKRQSQTLVTTALTSVRSQADREVYKSNEKSLQGWQYVAVLDARTTPLCAHRDGHIYPISDTEHLPPAHWHCRSVTVPVFKSWSDMAAIENSAQVRRRNLANLTDKQVAFYDGQTPLKETYNDWLLRQPQDVQLRHLGDQQKVQLFQSRQLNLDGFTNPEGNTIGIRELRTMTDSGYTLPNDTVKFANAKAKLDSMRLWASNPDDFINDMKLAKTLEDYYLLQAGELDGTLALTNYRGTLLQNKKATKRRVLTSPPTEDQLKYNPITNNYEDVRRYQPNISVLNNNLKLVRDSEKLEQKDKDFIENFVNGLSQKMGANERAVVTDNLRIIFGRYRENGESWANFKAVTQGQIKFDVMNVSDSIETQIRQGSDPLKRLLLDDYIDPVLGPTQLQTLHDEFIPNIFKKNKWEDTTAPKIARELRTVFDLNIPLKIKARITDRDLQQFYLRFAHRLSLADMPDRDQFAIALGRDLLNMANYSGSRNEWYDTGMAILDSKNANSLFTVETYGVQKRRMKSRLSNNYFGPYYDSLSYNIRVTDPRIQEYAKLSRKVDIGLRVSVTSDSNRLVFRENSKTYWVDRGILGYDDTRIPITSTSSYSDFPEEFIDKNMVDALNWASASKYKVDPDFYDFTKKLLYFQDDRGNAKKYTELNEYRKYMSSRGDAYERFKAMDWLREKDHSFSNNAFIDHRARIYDRGLISPQSGETFK